MSFKSPQQLLLVRVPDLNITRERPETQVPILLGPVHRRDMVAHPQISQLGDLGGVGLPKVDTGAEPNSQHVLRRPVKKVEVEVVL